MPLKRKTKVEPQFSFAAMIDVVFLLLLFFMVTSKFVTPNALNLQLPSSSATTMASPNLAVSIDRDGKFYLDSKPIAEANLEAGIRDRMTRLGEDKSKIVVTVVADKKAPVEDVVFVLDIANRLQIKTILATDPKN
ncbi:MAG: ExbD/TolR family protein [Saprospiraceae bacterium]